MAKSGEDAAADDPGRALDVVVEARDPVAVVVQQLYGVVLFEVLPLQKGVGKDLLDGLDEAVHKGVVVLAPEAVLGVAEVERVVEQLFVVGPAVKGDGQGQLGVDAGPGDVQGELADGDAHASGALVAEAQDALVVGDHDEAHARLGGVAEQLRNPLEVVGRDPNAPRAAEDVAVLPTGRAPPSGCR